MPPELKARPITLEDARRAGLQRWHLDTKSWRRIGPEVYVWASIRDTPAIQIAAARVRLPPNAAFSGLTAAWLHGLDVDPCHPIEATLPLEGGVSGRTGISIRRSWLDRRDTSVVRGVRATTIERTLADLSARLTITEAVVLADSALHLKLTTTKRLLEAASRGCHWRRSCQPCGCCWCWQSCLGRLHSSRFTIGMVASWVVRSSITRIRSWASSTTAGFTGRLWWKTTAVRTGSSPREFGSCGSPLRTFSTVLTLSSTKSELRSSVPAEIQRAVEDDLAGLIPSGMMSAG